MLPLPSTHAGPLDWAVWAGCHLSYPALVVGWYQGVISAPLGLLGVLGCAAVAVVLLAVRR